jgi:hypothetical protein
MEGDTFGLFIDKEVPMSATRRRSLHFDVLEGIVVLSQGLADPAVSIHQNLVQQLRLDGTLVGLPLGSPHQGGYNVSTFLVEGHAGWMHRITGFFDLADSFIPAGKEPNLSGATLTLANREGSVKLAVKWWKHNLYHFTVVLGSNDYTGVSGSGELAVLSSSDQGSMDFLIRLRTTIA